MRVALCLSGQMRSFERTFDSINENLIKPNNADVFIHSWFDPDHLRMVATDNSRGNLNLSHDAPPSWYTCTTRSK